MKAVMAKAQELAEEILNSTVYQKMKELESEVRHDPDAAKLLGDMIEKRNRVENILSSADMDPDELSRASAEMELAEKNMNENPRIQMLRNARKDFQTMMDNVNQILRLIITGQVEEESNGSAACSGNCSCCGGCQ